MNPRLDCFDFTKVPGATEEHRALQEALRRFVEREIIPYAAEWDEAEEFPRELYRQAAEVGLLGLSYPVEYGGTPCDTLSRLIAFVELCRASGGVNTGLTTHTLMLGPILKGARAEVKEEIVPPILAGTAIGALAVTEPSGGSDVAGLRTRAEPVPGGYKLNGSKIYISSGMRADYYLVAARTGGSGASGISLFVVDRDSKGFTRTPLKKMGWWCNDTATLYFDDVFVPNERLVGPENGGFPLIMNTFNSERLTIACNGMTFAMVCVEDALAWARERHAFGRPIISNQVIRQKFVRMIDAILPLQAWLAQLAVRIDAGETPVAEIAMAKNMAGRVMRDCADEGVQILGGAGFMRGSRIERIYRETKVVMIGGGTEEVLNDLVARQLALV